MGRREGSCLVAYSYRGINSIICFISALSSTLCLHDGVTVLYKFKCPLA